MAQFLAYLLLIAGASAGPSWDALRTTWDLNPLSKYGFAHMPRTVEDAKSEELKFIDDQCTETSPKFLGARYRFGDDVGLTLLYDKAGFIAGIQTCVPKDNYSPPATLMNHPFQDDGTCWALTVYFVDPSTICTTGRTDAEFEQSGTGDRLVLQNGTNPLTDVWTVPMTQAEIDKTLWNKGKCLPSMGRHYWYNVREDMPCDEYFPFFFLYNSGKLNAFGFTPPADTPLTSPRYEHPNLSKAKTCCLDPFPKCFNTDKYLKSPNTLHVYFTGHPLLTNFC